MRVINPRTLPALLDVTQSLSGLVLALFMWAHMLLVSSILISKDAMYLVAKLFEGYFLFGKSYPQLVTCVAVFIGGLFILHALLAMRKLPHNYLQYQKFRQHRISMAHGDTTMWWWQAVSGFLLFFLAPAHIYTMISQPDMIGPHTSSWRVYNSYWPLYLILLFVVELHGALGLYRLAIKWGWLGGDTAAGRKRLSGAKWVFTVFFIVLGLATLAAYYQIGASLETIPEPHRYVPEVMR